MTSRKRAHTDEEKQHRERAIITTAEHLLLQKGYSNINMSEVAQATGLAKGTLYLYFTTKEELFLAVFERQLNEFFEASVAALSQWDASWPHHALADWLTQAFVSRPHLTRLIAISSLLLEQNISFERARQHKVWIYGQLQQMSGLISGILGISEADAVAFVLRLYVFVAGLECVAHPAPVSLEVYAQDASLVQPDFAIHLNALIRMQIAALQSA